MAILSMQEEIKTRDWEELDSVFARTSEPLDNDVAVIILKIHHPAFASNQKSYDYSIWGKTLTEWVSLAFDTCPILEIETSLNADILQTIKPCLSDKKYTAVFYADTPLLQRKTFLSVLDYAKTKRMNVCKLERGFVFVTDYLRTAEKIYASTTANLDFQDDFYMVSDMDSLNYASEKLKKRIINFHLQHGVQILDSNWTSIDADVTIGKNVVIYPQNILQGKTHICDNVILKAGNTIDNSLIGKNCQVMHSVIETSKIRDNSIIEPFSYIKNGEIKK
ncbi:MAG: hypothetical protein J6C13_02400 [Clostridia bacterium]|nr:hypothetical protein [Clostridia bacterium]